MNFPKILNNSIALRTTTLVLCVLTIILVAAGLWQMKYVKDTISDDLQWQTSRSLAGATKIIDNRLLNIETAVNTAAMYAETAAQNKQTAKRLLEGIVATSNDITAATILYKENFFPEEGKYFAPTVAKDNKNNLSYHEIGGEKFNFYYLENDSNWVYTHKTNKPYWSLPFVAISTKRTMVSYSVPLHDKSGDIFAVLCASLDLAWVERVINEAKPYDFAKVSILSRDAKFIYHPIKKHIMTANAINIAKAQQNNKSVEITNKMLQWQRGVDTMFAPLLSTDMEGDSIEYSQAKQEKLIIYYSPIERVKWSINYTIPYNKLMEHPIQMSKNMLFILFAVLFTLAIVMYIVIRAQIWPLKQLEKSARHIAKGNFDVKFPIIKTQDEIRHLRDSFSYMQTSLLQHIQQLQNTTASKAAIERELSIASNIQMAMIPKQNPPFPERNDIDICGLLTPAKQVGGDLFDYFIRDEKLFFCIGDVSGKGVPASIVMAVTTTLFHSIAAHEANPERIMTILNDTMTTNNEANMFVTLFIGVLDLPTGRLRFCNAGHNAPILIGHTKGFLPIEPNLPIGVMPGWEYKMQDTLIDPDTVIFVYTDGLTEATNEENKLFGEKRMMDSIKLNESPKSVLDKMTENVKQFVGQAEQSDDLTMLAIQYKKKLANIRMQKSITISNDVEKISHLSDFVENVCNEIDFDTAITMQMNLALEEAVANVVNYAYPKGIKGNINIEAKCSDERLKFIITDNGVPFDPTKKEDVDTTLSVEERPIGGLGIFLVRQLMDSINYERIDGKNVLTLIKKLHNNE